MVLMGSVWDPAEAGAAAASDCSGGGGCGAALPLPLLPAGQAAPAEADGELPGRGDVLAAGAGLAAPGAAALGLAPAVLILRMRREGKRLLVRGGRARPASGRFVVGG